MLSRPTAHEHLSFWCGLDNWYLILPQPVRGNISNWSNKGGGSLINMKGYERLRAVAKRMKNEVDSGAAPGPEQLTVREFLSWFGYARRGRNKVSRIRHVLAELELRTIPDFEVTWVDARISIELDPEAVEGIAASEGQIDPTVRIGAIEAANRRPATVDPNSPLSVATTLMQTNYFSNCL